MHDKGQSSRPKASEHSPDLQPPGDLIHSSLLDPSGLKWQGLESLEPRLLLSTAPVLGSTTASMLSIHEDSVDTHPMPIAQLLQQLQATDVEGDILGAAVTGVDNTHGQWQFALHDGNATFVDRIYNGQRHFDYLQGAKAVVFSPDGKHVYFASDGYQFDGILAAGVDWETGELVSIDQYMQATWNSLSGLDGAHDLAISPDGGHIYAVGRHDDAVAVFSRDAGTGELTFVTSYSDGVGGVDGLDGAHAVSVSGDGAHVYIKAGIDNALAVFARNATTGELTFVEAQIDGVGGVDGLDDSFSEPTVSYWNKFNTALAISPDGESVYACGYNDGVALFNRDATTGALTFLEVLKDGQGGIVGLIDVMDLTVSGDGRDVYVASHVNSVLHFSRDGETGQLTYQGLYEQGAGDVVEMNGPNRVVVSPDGRQVWVACGDGSTAGDGGITIFDRDASTGALTYRGALPNRDADDNILSADIGGLAFDPAGQMAVSADVSISQWSRTLLAPENLGAPGGVVDLTAAAALLPMDALIRFEPDADYNGPATFTMRAWDQSVGMVGGEADTTAPGGTSGFSAEEATVTLTVEAVAEAPVATDDQAEARSGAVALIDILANDTAAESNIDPASVRIHTNPVSQPQLVDHLEDPGAYKLSAEGDRLYLITSSSFTIADLGDPGEVTVRGQLTGLSGGPMRELVIDNGRAVIAGEYALLVIDISDPDSPQLLGSLSGGGRDVAVAGDYAYLAAFDGVEVISLVDPTAPTVVQSKSFWDTCYSVATDGDYVYAGSSKWFGVWQINPADGTLTQIGDTSIAPSYNVPSDIWLDGDLAYAASTHGLAVVDISDPTLPELMSFFDMDYGYDNATHVEVEDGIAYVSTSLNAGLYILDARDPFQVTEIAQYGASYYGFALHGNHALLPNGSTGGLDVVEVRDGYPHHGRVSIDPATGVVTYRSNPGFAGADGFTYTVAEDSEGHHSEPARVDLNVRYNAPPEFTVDDQVILPGQTSATIDLPATDADGDALSYSVNVISREAEAYRVRTEAGIVSYDPANDNSHGWGAKWFQDDAGAWFWMTPDGRLSRWSDQQQIGVVDPMYFDAPDAFLTAADMAAPVTATVTGNQVVLTPDAGFIGTVPVEIIGSDGAAETVEPLMLHVIGYDAIAGVTIARGVEYGANGSTADDTELFRFMFDWTAPDLGIMQATLTLPDGTTQVPIEHAFFEGDRVMFEHLAKLDTAEAQAAYTWGDYTLTLDFGVAQIATTFSLEDPASPGTASALPAIEQEPTFVTPTDGTFGAALSQTIEWAAVTDADVNQIIVMVEGLNNDEFTEQQITDTTTTSFGPVTLSAESSYIVRLIFGGGATATNADGIDYQVARFSSADAFVSTKATPADVWSAAQEVILGRGVDYQTNGSTGDDEQVFFFEMDWAEPGWVRQATLTAPDGTTTVQLQRHEPMEEPMGPDDGTDPLQADDMTPMEYWEAEVSSLDPADLATFGPGEYTLTLTLAGGQTVSTTFAYEDPANPGAGDPVATVDEEPTWVTPTAGAAMGGTVTFEWNAPTDPDVDFVELTVEQVGPLGQGGWEIVEEGFTDTTTTTFTPLEPLAAGGSYMARLGFYHVESLTNPDGIAYEIGAGSESEVPFSVAPDLAPSDLAYTGQIVREGNPLDVSLTLNELNGAAAGPFFVQWRLSTDTTWGNADDLVLDTFEIMGMGPGDTFTDSYQLMIPHGVPAGAYYLAAMMDRQGEVAESDETNNTVFSAAADIVVNTPPTISLDDQVISNTQDTYSLTLPETDDDGQTLTYSATVVSAEQLAWDLGVREYLPSYDDLRGGGEKYLRTATGGYYILLSDGEMRQWNTTIANSPVVAQLGPNYYADPASLVSASQPAAVATATVDANVLTVDPDAGYAGTLLVDVTASDGFEQAGDKFGLTLLPLDALSDVAIIRGTDFGLNSDTGDTVHAFMFEFDWPMAGVLVGASLTLPDGTTTVDCVMDGEFEGTEQWVYELVNPDSSALDAYAWGAYTLSLDLGFATLETTFNFEDPAAPGTGTALADIEQEPTWVNPPDGQGTIATNSALRWEAVTDADVNVIFLDVEQVGDQPAFLAEEEFTDTTVTHFKPGQPFEAEADYAGQLFFGNLHQATNADGIAYEVGRFSSSKADIHAIAAGDGFTNVMIGTGIDYGQPGDATDDQHGFVFEMGWSKASDIESAALTLPDGVTQVNLTRDADGGPDGGEWWAYELFSTAEADLSAYSAGTYTLTLSFYDGGSMVTSFVYEDPANPGAGDPVPTVDEEPTWLTPTDGAGVAIDTLFQWEAPTDPDVTFVEILVDQMVGGQAEGLFDIFVEDPTVTSAAGPEALPGGAEFEAELSFMAGHEGVNDDGVVYHFGHLTASVIAFTTPSELSIDLLTAYPGQFAELDDISSNATLAETAGVATGPFTVRYALSTDTVWGNADDVDLGVSDPVPGLAGNSTQILQQGFTIPAGTPAGEYYLAAMIDAGEQVIEGDETNNVTFTAEAGIIVNNPPTLELTDQAMPNTQADLDVTLPATDSDGQTLIYSATVQTAEQFAWELGIRSYVSAFDNARGAGEKYLKTDTGKYYILLPDGKCQRWGGTLAASVTVANLAGAYYADPTLLVSDAEPGAKATVSVTDNTITVDPQADFAGTLIVEVLADDGYEPANGSFSVHVLPLGDVQEVHLSKGLDHNDASDATDDQYIFEFEFAWANPLPLAGATLTLPDGTTTVDLTAENDPFGPQWWQFEQTSVVEADLSAFGYGEYTLTLDLGFAQMETAFAFEDPSNPGAGDPLAGVEQTPAWLTPAPSAGAAPANVVFEWEAVTDPDVTMIILDVFGQQPDQELFAMLEDQSVTTYAPQDPLAEDTLYEAELSFANARERINADGITYVFGLFSSSDTSFTTMSMDPLTHVSMGRGVDYGVNGDASDNQYVFQFEFEWAGQTPVASATLTLPDGTTVVDLAPEDLGPEADGELWIHEAASAVEADLAGYTTGAYELAITLDSGETIVTRFAYEDPSNPGAGDPLATVDEEPTWVTPLDGQGVSIDTLLQWQAATDADVNMIEVMVFDAADDDVAGQMFDDATATSYQPTQPLPGGASLSAELLFFAGQEGVNANGVVYHYGTVAASTIAFSTPSDLSAGAVLVAEPSEGSFQPGDTIDVSAALAELSGVGTGGFTVGYVLSTDEVFGNGDDIALGDAAYPGLSAGGSANQQVSLTLPGDVPAGNYYLGAFIDSGEVVPESDETNNVGFTTLPEVVVNNPPTLDVADTVIPNTQDTYTQSFPAVDGDGQDLTYTVSVRSAERLVWDLGIRTYVSAYDDARGAGEKYLKTAAGKYYIFMPTGELKLWSGTIAGSETVAKLNPLFYADPTSLLSTSAPAEVATAGFAGADLTVAPQSGYTGTLIVEVTVDDGVSQTAGEFAINLMPLDAIEEIRIGTGFDYGLNGSAVDDRYVFGFDFLWPEAIPLTGATLTLPDGTTTVDVVQAEPFEDLNWWRFKAADAEAAQMTQYTWGEYTLTLDLGFGTLETTFAYEDPANPGAGDPLAGIDEEPTWTNPVAGATTIPAGANLAWQAATDADTTWVALRVEQDGTGVVIDEFFTDTTVAQFNPTEDFIVGESYTGSIGFINGRQATNADGLTYMMGVSASAWANFEAVSMSDLGLVEMGRGVEYGVNGDATDDEYAFFFEMQWQSAGQVASATLTLPDGTTTVDLALEETSPFGPEVWSYELASAVEADLSAYAAGDYTLTVTLTGGGTLITSFAYEDPANPGAGDPVPTVDEEPTWTSPLNGAGVAAEAQLGWTAATDADVNMVVLEVSDGQDILVDEFYEDATVAGFTPEQPWKKGVSYAGELTFVAGVETTNLDGVAVFYGSFASSEVSFAARPDLSLQSPNYVSGAYAPGDALTASATMVELNGLSSGGFHVTLALSTDTTWGNADDIVLGTGPDHPGLPGGASQTESMLVTIPAGAASGDYYLAAFIDSGEAVSEADETNNVIFSAAADIAINNGPTLELSDASMSHLDDTYTLTMDATDADGETLTYLATVKSAAQFGYELGISEYFAAYDNMRGAGEKYLYAAASRKYYIILSDGQLKQWTGTVAGSPNVAKVGTACYADPTQLIASAPPATVASAGCTDNVLTVDPQAGFSGALIVTVTATDPLGQSATDSFTLTVANPNGPALDLADATQSYTDGDYTLTLDATDADGDTISYSASLQSAEQLAWELGIAEYRSQYDNIRGQGEKFLYAPTSGQYFVIYPDGRLVQWGVDGTLATVAESYHEDPTRLISETEPTLAATASFTDNVLTVSPGGYSGTLIVTVDATDGAAEATDSFHLTITNTKPTLDLTDATMAHRDDTYTLTLDATDADGETITYAATVQSVEQFGYDLGFSKYYDLYDNARGAGEKYLSTTGGTWYILLAGGELRKWAGTVAGSEVVTTLGSAAYDDPTLLIQTSAPADVATASFAANVLTVDPTGYAGGLIVTVTATDEADQSAEGSFLLEVTNANAPTLDLSDATISYTAGTHTVTLDAADADGDTIAYSVSLTSAEQLAWDLGLAEYVASYDNARGLGEKYIRTSSGAYYMLHTDGRLIGWGQNDPVMTLASSYYNDPSTLISQAEPTLAASASFTDNVLTVDPNGYLGTLLVEVAATDGAAEVEGEFLLSVVNTPPTLDLADASIPHTTDTYTLTLDETDSDGETITYAATVQSAEQFGHELGISTYYGAYDNARGAGEKYLYASASKKWYIIVDGGVLKRWTGTVAGSPTVATLGSPYHTDPTRLIHTSAPADVATAGFAANVLTVDPTNYAGSLIVTVTATDEVDQSVEDSFLLQVTNPNAPQLALDDATVSHTEDTWTLTLDAADADGDTIAYSATVASAEQFAYELGISQYRSDYDNARGLGEKYLYAAGSGSWYLLHTDGRLIKWAADSPVATLAEAYYDDPDRLVNASAPAEVATASFTDNVLTVDPADGFTGTLIVSIDATDGAETDNGSFCLHVVNLPPTLDLSDQQIAHTDDTYTQDLAATDAEGEAVTYAVTVKSAEQVGYGLGLSAYYDAYDDARGAGEKYIYAAGPKKWYILLPSGQLRRWSGTVDGSATVATFGSTYYDDPTTLIHTSAPADVATASFSGATLTVDPDAGFVGSLIVTVTATDASGQQAEDSFRLDVVNPNQPVLDLADATMNASDGQYDLVLDATDADGDPITYTPSVVSAEQFAYQLGVAEYIAAYDNARGADEKYLRTPAGQYYLIMPDGTLRRWSGTVAGSAVVATLNASYHADPSLLVSPVAPADQATATMSGSTLTVTPEASYVGVLLVTVEATDGLATVSDTFSLEVANAAPTPVVGAYQHDPAEGVWSMTLPTEDPDGEPVQYDVSLATAEQLTWRLGITEYRQAYDNLRGAGEKYLYAAGTRTWYVLTADGAIRRWAGSFAASETLADLGDGYYEDPSRLVASAAPTTRAVAVVLGNTLTVDPADYTGTLLVSVTAADPQGLTTTFTLSVEVNV